MAKEKLIAITGTSGHLATTVIPMLLIKGYLQSWRAAISNPADSLRAE